MNQGIKSELLKIKGRSKAISPVQVVSFAESNPDSSIFAAFESRGLWDDETAAQVARNEYARHLIQRFRVKITMPDRKTRTVRAFVSLSNERQSDCSPSYRFRQDVQKDEARWRQFCMDCAGELERFVERFPDVLEDEESRTLKTVAAAISQRGASPRPSKRSRRRTTAVPTKVVHAGA